MSNKVSYELFCISPGEEGDQGEAILMMKMLGKGFSIINATSNGKGSIVYILSK